MTKGELNFRDQYTRKLMVALCHSAMVYGGDPLFGLVAGRRQLDTPFLNYAVEKKWLNADMTKVLSLGWSTAAAFLRR